ncbi:MAG TPA: hypothetical protein VLE73_02185 [Candidatus Saccharimonadales bacterium]|nr:hypothetical protein [Candidatus Saccharimonadales bacterium]
MTETVPEFGLFRPLTPESAQILGAVATAAVDEIADYYTKQDYPCLVKSRSPVATGAAAVCPSTRGCERA